MLNKLTIQLFKVDDQHEWRIKMEMEQWRGIHKYIHVRIKIVKNNNNYRQHTLILIGIYDFLMLFFLKKCLVFSVQFSVLVFQKSWIFQFVGQKTENWELRMRILFDELHGVDPTLSNLTHILLKLIKTLLQIMGSWRAHSNNSTCLCWD